MNRKIGTGTLLLIVTLTGVVIAYPLIDRALFHQYAQTTISWTNATVSDTDELPYEISGYDIHCWAEGGKFTKMIHIGDPSITHYVIEDIAPRKYSCAVSALTKDGRESALSNVVATTLH